MTQKTTVKRLSRDYSEIVDCEHRSAALNDTIFSFKANWKDREQLMKDCAAEVSCHIESGLGPTHKNTFVVVDNETDEALFVGQPIQCVDFLSHIIVKKEKDELRASYYDLYDRGEMDRFLTMINKWMGGKYDNTNR